MLICLQKEQVWFQDLQVACGELWFSESFINHVTTHEIEGNHYKVTKLIFINSEQVL